MNMLPAKIKNNYFMLFLAAFIVLHAALLNANAAEWGDSYRILRASQFIRQLSYPQDEKRPPLFSALLATYPPNVDPVRWGRVLMLAVSVCSFYVFYLLSKQLLGKNETAVYLALMLFMFNPVYLYWSIRIMADVPFAFLAMLAVYLYTVWKKNLTVWRYVILGLITGLAILTRFEGYVLLGSFLLAIGIEQRKKLATALAYPATALVTILPYLLYVNPLSSKYLTEPANRVYDLKTLLVFLVSLLFLFGFTSALYFAFFNRRNLWMILKENRVVLFFVGFELLLILVWPAAIPRLFVAIIPFLIILLAKCITAYFDGEIFHKAKFFILRLFDKDFYVVQLFVVMGLLALYIASLFLFSLQFLVIAKYAFLALVAVGLVNIVAIIFRARTIFVVSMCVSCLIWSFAVIWMHKDIFKQLNSAGVLAKTLPGPIAYNDVSALTPWHLGDKGVYIDLTNKEKGSYERLVDENIRYVMVTNEHNPQLKYDLGKRPFLLLVKEFRGTVNGQEFFTFVAEVLPGGK